MQKHFLADGATENGVDQGDALISEQELATVHAAGYYSAIPAGVQTVMASFQAGVEENFMATRNY